MAPLLQLLLALRFYALGTMLVSVADYVGVSIPTASRIVASVSRAIGGLYTEHIKMGEHTQLEFYSIAGFPRVHGAVDGTHIPIQSPCKYVGNLQKKNCNTIFVPVLIDIIYNSFQVLILEKNLEIEKAYFR